MQLICKEVGINATIPRIPPFTLEFVISFFIVVGKWCSSSLVRELSPDDFDNYLHLFWKIFKVVGYENANTRSFIHQKYVFFIVLIYGCSVWIGFEYVFLPFSLILFNKRVLKDFLKQKFCSQWIFHSYTDFPSFFTTSYQFGLFWK
jgi:hypothetical protein